MVDPSRYRPLALAVGASLLYGSWALYANRGTGSAARAALAQVTFSFCATLTLALVLERLFRAGRTPDQGFWLAAVGTSTLAAALVTTTHLLASTPHLLLTVAPSITIGTLVYFSYAFGLRSAARRGAAEGPQG